MFLSKALRRAEVFLEQVDESVAQASRRLVVEGAVGAVNDTEDDYDSEEEESLSRASSIPKAERPNVTPVKANGESASSDAVEGDDPAEEVGENTTVHADPREDGPGSTTPSDADGETAATQAVSSTPGRTATAAGEDMAGDKPEEPQHEERITASEENTAAGDSDTHEKPAEVVPAVRKSQSEASVASSAALTALSPSDVQISLPEATSNASLEPSASALSTTSASSATAPGKRSHVSVMPPSSTTATSAAPVVTDEYMGALQEENGALRKELEGLEDTFEKGRRERSKLVKNLKRMKEIVAEMDESLQEKSVEARTLQDELDKVRDELNAVRTSSIQSTARGKDSLDTLRKELSTEIETLRTRADSATRDSNTLREENERLKDAMVQGQAVDQATTDGAREEASQAHRAYDAENIAHRETRRQAKEREEGFQEEAALAAVALASAERKAEEAVIAMNAARSMQRAADGKLSTVTSARDAAFARVEDLEAALRMYDKGDGNEAPGQKEAKEMQETVSELENALEAKNVELTRLEGETEALRAAMKGRRDATSPRAGAGRAEGGHVDVEVKLRHMADSALRKQAQLEVLRSENRALQQQLSTERKRTREAQAMAAAASSSRQTIRGGFRGLLDPGESERGDRLYGVRDGPLARLRAPRSWPRAVVSVLAGVDRVCAQGLALLRKEPVLRIVLVVYMALMHVFVYSLLHWHVDAVAGGRVVGGKGVVAAGAATAAGAAKKVVEKVAKKAAEQVKK